MMQISSRRRRTLERAGLAGAALLMIALYIFSAFPAAAFQPGNQHFLRTWERTDRPVIEGVTARTWMWGPQAFTEVMREPYQESPDGTRQVQYYDKARMEITNPNSDVSSIWHVTNGLLVVELISGKMQLGDDTFEQRTPALVNVAGDADDPTGPTYASFQTLLDNPAQPLNATITARVDRAGNVSSDPSLGEQGVIVGYIDEVTNHAIAAPFWDFMNSTGTVYESGLFVASQLFENEYFATGRPITEAYWANVKVGGTYRDVLMQCFERRCLTFTPGNPEGFVVEAGNVGQHYHAWRYAEEPEEEPDPIETPTEPEPTPTEEASPTPTESPATPTEEPSPTPEPEPEPATQYQFVNAWGGRSVSSSALANPNGVAVGPNGNVYIVDGSHRVHVFTSEGIWIKNWGEKGDNPGQFDKPNGIAVDAHGNVYVADSGNARIQKFDADGALIHYWSVAGYPMDVAVHPELGLLFVADMSSHKIHVYHFDGRNNRSWGELGSDPGQLFTPNAVEVGPDGNIYVTEFSNNRFQVFTWEGEYLSGYGATGKGPGEFRGPSGIATTQGGGSPASYGISVYVSDSLNHRIQIFTLTPDLVTASDRTLASYSTSYSGEFGTRGTDDGQFIVPEGLAFDANGKLIVADKRNDRVQKFGRSFTGKIQHLDSWYDDTRGRFQQLYQLEFGPDERIYASDPELGQIQIFSPEGDFIDLLRDLPAAGMTFDSQGILYVTNSEEGRVEQYDLDGTFLSAWEPGGTTFFRQGALDTDAEDNIYVLQSLVGSIQKFRPDGTYIDAWGSVGAQPGQFRTPADIAINGDYIYVADMGNHRIQQFDLDGRFIRLWGGEEASGDGEFNAPTGIAVDADGYVYVVDTDNDRIQKFTPDGEFVAKWGTRGSGPGQFLHPTGIAIDPDGNVYVVDSGNDRIQVFKPVS